MSRWPPVLRNVARFVEYNLQKHPDVSLAWVEAHFPLVVGSSDHTVKGASGMGLTGVEAGWLHRTSSGSALQDCRPTKEAENLKFHVKPPNLKIVALYPVFERHWQNKSHPSVGWIT